MSNNLKPIALVGLGQMAIDYAKVLNELKIPYFAVGRSASKTEKFKDATGVAPVIGGIENFVSQHKEIDTYIVAVDVLQLYPVVNFLVQNGASKILIEKPAALYADELINLQKISEAKKVEINIAYNRRFYASVQRVLEIVKEDGGISSMHFEFTEWSHVISKIEKPDEVKQNWLMANSTHVIDLAFFLSGEPKDFCHYKKGNLDWHNAGAVFVGSGLTEKDIPFSYHSNWEAPGRWSVEILTRKHRLYLKPMERLFVQKIGSVELNEESIDDQFDKQFKPGLYKQTESFLFGKDTHKLCGLKEHTNLTVNFYSQIIK